MCNPSTCMIDWMINKKLCISRIPSLSSSSHQIASHILNRHFLTKFPVPCDPRGHSASRTYIVQYIYWQQFTPSFILKFCEIYLLQFTQDKNTSPEVRFPFSLLSHGASSVLCRYRIVTETRLSISDTHLCSSYRAFVQLANKV